MIPHLFYILFFVFIFPYLFFKIFKIDDNSVKDLIRLLILGSYFWLIISILLEKNQNNYFISFDQFNLIKLIVLYKNLVTAHFIFIFISFVIQWILLNIIESLNWRFKSYDSYNKSKNEYDFVIINLANVIFTSLSILYLLTSISK
jgi:hypothetical protein